MMQSVKEYNQKFQTKKSKKEYPSNNKYAYSVSPDLHNVLVHYKKVLDKYESDEEREEAFEREYKRDTMFEVWEEMHLRVT